MLTRPDVHGMHFNPLKPIFESIGVKLVPNGAEEGQHVYQRGRALEPERARRISEAAMGTFFGTSRETNLNAAMPPDGSSIADFARYVFDGLGRDADAARMCLEAMSGWTGADLDDVALRWWGFEQGEMPPSVARLTLQTIPAPMRSSRAVTASSYVGSRPRSAITAAWSISAILSSASLSTASRRSR